MTFSQDIQESILGAFADATNTPIQAVRMSITDSEKRTINLEANNSEVNGETNTSLTIEEVANGKFRLTGSIASPQRSLQVDRTIVASPSQIPIMIKQVLVCARVTRNNPNSKNLINKIKSYV